MSGKYFILLYQTSSFLSEGDLDADFIEKMLQAKFMNSYKEIFGLQIGNEQSRMGRSGT